MRVAILNAGEQTDYLYGLVSGLSTVDGLSIDVVDSNNSIGLFDRFPRVFLHTLRGGQRPSDPLLRKSVGILWYYLRLVIFAFRTSARVFHIQWDNSILLFDRTILIMLYRLARKKIVYTAHNLYREERDGRGTRLRFWSLKHLYQSVDALVVHTPDMKEELCRRFGVAPERVSVIPHGINNRVSVRGITRQEARAQLNIRNDRKLLLFFGYLDRYKGPDLLIDALAILRRSDESYALVMAGAPKRRDGFTRSLRRRIDGLGLADSARMDLRFIPETEIEPYFAAADCLVLPYRKIFQSGLIFLAYRFGLPIVATDVGSFREDIQNAGAGIVAEQPTPEAIADAVQSFFAGPFVQNPEAVRAHIRRMAEERYSWNAIGRRTAELYRSLLPDAGGSIS